MNKKFKEYLNKIKPIKYYLKGKKILNDPLFVEGHEKNIIENSKFPSRSIIINYLLFQKKDVTYYLEIGVRNPAHNFEHIKATKKYSVDPGLEYEQNPVDYKMTSDEFFLKLSNSEILSNDIKFDVIFIDGLHLAEQVDRDIINSLKYIKEDGFIVLHDCNPPTEWHSRENYRYWNSPAQSYWNGTTWKAFLKWRSSPIVNSCCIDSDWGVGLISKKCPIGKHIEPINPFFEFNNLQENRNKSLNLVDFEAFKKLLNSDV